MIISTGTTKLKWKLSGVSSHTEKMAFSIKRKLRMDRRHTKTKVFYQAEPDYYDSIADLNREWDQEHID